MTELLPCPFCGGEASHRQRPLNNGYPDLHEIWCENMGCEVGVETVDGDFDIAAKIWNTRAPSQSDVMRTAEKAAETVASWSPSKQAYAARVTGASGDAQTERTYAQGVEDANQMVGALWSDLFNKDMVNRGADQFFDKWRDRIKALVVPSTEGKSHDPVRTFSQCEQCWQPATCKKYGCRDLSPASPVPSTDGHTRFCAIHTVGECSCAVTSTPRATPVMQAAENAARVVERWSDSKKEYADRVVSPADRGGAA